MTDTNKATPPVHAALNQPDESSTPDSTPPPAPSYSPGFTSNQKKMFVGLAVFALLVGGAITGSILVQRQTGGEEARAGSGNVDLQLVSKAAGDVSHPDTFDVEVVVQSSNGKDVTAADLVFDYPAEAFTLTNLTIGGAAGSYFEATTKKPETLSGEELYNNNTEGRIAIGAICDRCYLGEYDGSFGTIEACATYLPSGETATCYPINSTSATSNVLATATFAVKDTAPANTYTISLVDDNAMNPTTQVAVIDLDTNDLGLVQSTTVNVLGSSSGQSCGGADISADGVTYGQDGIAGLSDFSYLVSQWSGFSTCQ